MLDNDVAVLIARQAMAVVLISLVYTIVDCRSAPRLGASILFIVALTMVARNQPVDWLQGTNSCSKKRRLLLLLGVAVISMTSYVGHKQTKATSWFPKFNGNLEVIQAINLSKEETSTSVYPSDYVTIYNIRSAVLVSTWYGAGNNDICCGPLSQTVDGRKSRMLVDNVDSAGNVYVRIVLYDISGKRRKHGGDVLFVWAEGKQNGGRVAGSVVDHLNGTYIARLKMLWNGTTFIRAKVVAKSGISCLRLRAMKKYENSVFSVKTPHGIHFRFRNGNASDITRCAPTSFLPEYEKLCNFTAVNFGLSWFCGHPNHPSLNCSDFTNFRMLPYNKAKLIPNQQKEEVIDVPIVVRLKSTMTLGFYSSHKGSNVIDNQLCKDRSARSSWVARYPTGYFLNGHWKETNCLNTVITRGKARQCLKGKEIVALGDSTVRQYVEDIAKLINRPSVCSKLCCRVTAPDLDINICWNKHEMPYHTSQWFSRGVLNGTAHQIRLLANDMSISGAGLILLLTYNTHLQAFSTSVFRSRIIFAVDAIRYLLEKKPGVRIFFKGPHVPADSKKWFDARVALLFRDVIFEEFMDIRESVVYLDTMSTSIAHNSLLLHPIGRTLRSQTAQMLSYIC